MKKFETPTLQLDMFDVIDVMTVSSSDMEDASTEVRHTLPLDPEPED